MSRPALQLDKAIYREYLSIISHSLDSVSYLNNNKSLMMAEGLNDICFFEKIGINSNLLFPNGAKKLFVNDSLLTKGEKPTKEDYNVKSAKKFIVDSILALNYIDEIYDKNKADEVKVINNFNKWNIYGTIDHDYALYNPNDPNKGLGKLFCNNTSTDLETMMMSSHTTLIKDTLANNGIEISDDDIWKVYFMAYQIGLVKSFITNRKNKNKNGAYNDKFRFGSVSYTKADVDYLFDDNYTLYIDSLLEMFNKANLANEQDIDDCYNDFMDYHNRIFDYQGNWKINYKSIRVKQPKDLWRTISGHDLAEMLMAVSQQAREKFTGSREKKQIESEFVKYYDVTKFVLTDLFSQLKSRNLV